MVGPAVDGRGGMSSVAAAYRDVGLFERCRVRYLTTVTAKPGAAAKLLIAAQAWAELLGLLLRRRIGLAHIHVASGASFWRKAIYAWTLRFAGVPVILHVHGGNFMQFYREAPAVGQRLIRATFDQAACVIVLSQVWVERVSEFVDRRKCHAIGNPVVAWPLATPVPRPVRSFLFLGRFEREKGIQELLTAFAFVHQHEPEVQLLLGGEGDVEAIQRQTAAAGTQAAVQILGWVSGETKRRAFAQADAFVLPSYIEGLPVAMLEAMYCGLPVIATSVGSIPEVIADGVQGLLVQPGDSGALGQAMLNLVRDATLSQRLGAQGKLVFDARFDARIVGQQVEHLYAEHRLAGR